MKTQSENDEKQTREVAAFQMYLLIIKFFESRIESRIRQTDLWRIMKNKYSNHNVVRYWKDREKENHGMAPEINKLINKHSDLLTIKLGPREVYHELSPESKFKIRLKKSKVYASHPEDEDSDIQEGV